MAQGRTFEDGQRARELYDRGLSCNAIAKELGVSPSTISTWAKREGLSFDRGLTEDAVNVRRVSRAARRSDIIERLYARAEHVLDRLEAETYVYYVSVPGSGAERIEDSEPPAIDEKNLATAIHSYLKDAAELEALDDTDGVAEADSMLGRLARRFGLVD